MNANERGRENGFTYKLSIIGGSKRHFEHTGRNAARNTYTLASKRREYLAGWMENWQDDPNGYYEDGLAEYPTILPGRYTDVLTY